QLDYIRYLGSSVETAKEVKLFALDGFLIARFRRFAEAMFRDNRRLATRRALWGALFAAFGSIAYYLSFAFIVCRTLSGSFSLVAMPFLAASFLRLRTLIDGVLLSFSQVAGQALYLEDLFAFHATAPRLVSPAKAQAMRRPIRSGFRFEDVGFRYDGSE